jgi:hypothetical protein
MCSRCVYSKRDLIFRRPLHRKRRWPAKRNLYRLALQRDRASTYLDIVRRGPFYEGRNSTVHWPMYVFVPLFSFFLLKSEIDRAQPRLRAAATARLCGTSPVRISCMSLAVLLLFQHSVRLLFFPSGLRVHSSRCTYVVAGDYADLWRFDLGTGSWTFVSGPQGPNPPPPAQSPSARSEAVGWVRILDMRSSAPTCFAKTQRVL